MAKDQIEGAVQGQVGERASGDSAADDRLKRPISMVDRKRRSGGPRTEEGKLRSSQNALKHGAYAASLPKSQLDEFYQIRGFAVTELSPKGMLQQLQAESAAHEMWRLKQIEAYERLQFIRSERFEVSLVDLARLTGFPFAETHTEMLTEPQNEALLQRRLGEFFLRDCKPPPREPGQVRTAPDQRAQRLHKKATEKLLGPPLLQHMEYEFFGELDVVMLEARDGQNYIGHRLRKNKDMQPLIEYWLYRNASLIERCRDDLRQERVGKEAMNPNTQRARSHGHKTLKTALQTLESLKCPRCC